MCLFCSKEEKHYVIYCTYCSKMVGCSDSSVEVMNHLTSACEVTYCDHHGWTQDKPGQHWSTCSICKSAFECGAECPNGCCSVCSKRAWPSGLCHCLGPCGQKECNCEGDFPMHNPEHSIKTLQAFGCVDEKGKPYNLSADARKFYGAVAMYQMKPTEENRRIMQAVSEELARKFELAIVVACAGEFRSSVSAGQQWLNRRNKGEEKGKFKKIKLKNGVEDAAFYFDDYYMMSRPRGLGMYNRAIRIKHRGDDGAQRTSSALTYKQFVLDPYGYEVGLRHNVNFWRMQGGGGVGGLKWADAAEVGLRYVKGELTPMVFVDLAFNLQHNNAILFTKTHRRDGHIQNWLNKRQQAQPGWLIERAPQDLREAMGFGDYRSEAAERRDATTDKRATKFWTSEVTPEVVKKIVKGVKPKEEVLV